MTTSLATLSIKFDPQYSALRICAQTCVDRGNDNSDLEGHLECGDSKILNACFCRDDLRPKATTFLSSCIISRCRYNDQDVTSAWNLYDGYCSFEPLLATTAVSTTRSGSTESAMSTTTISPTRPSTGPASSTNPAASPPAPPALSESPDSSNTAKISSAGEPISAGAIAGIVIGGVITLILGVAIVIWIRRRGRGNRQTMMGATKPGEYPGSSYLQGAVPDKVEKSRGAESFDMGTMTAAKMETTLPHSLMGDTSPLVQPVEICDTGFRAELSAGDDVRYSKEKTWQLPT